MIKEREYNQSSNLYTSGKVIHLSNFVNDITANDWTSYLETMKAKHTFGDHITLHAATKLFDAHFLVLSSLGADATVFVSKKSVGEYVYEKLIMVLRYVAETDYELVKEHYVCLSSSTGVTKFRNYKLAQLLKMMMADHQILGPTACNDLLSKMLDKLVNSRKSGAPYAPLLESADAQPGQPWAER